MNFERATCRLCDTVLPYENIIDLGEQLVSDFPWSEQLPPADERRVPLQLVRCVNEDCGLVQLRHTSPRDWHYKGDYWYRSGVNEAMVIALRSIVTSLYGAGIVDLQAGDTWIDIGANDGTLLHQLIDWMGNLGLRKVAVEPAPTFGGTLEEYADVVMPTYWPTRYDGPKAKVITSIAMFYDLEDPHSFVEGIMQALHPDGVWIVQYSDLTSLYALRDVGAICHEHLCYYSMRPVERLLQQHALEVFRVERNAVNGASVRLYVGHRGRHSIDPTVPAARQQEPTDMQDAMFAANVTQAGSMLGVAWQSLLNSGVKVVDIYGASTKGNTLLQFWPPPVKLRWAWERSREKWGRCTVTGVLIVSEELGRANPPDALYVLPWHFRAGILEREKAYLKQGGKMLFPLPNAEVVE